MVGQGPERPGMTDSLEARIARLEAVESIRDLVARYALAADRKNDPAMLGPLFHDNATWEATGFDLLAGPDNIAAGLAEIARTKIRWTLHYMVAPFVEFDEGGHSARCRWYLWELASMHSADGADKDTWLGGFYDTTVTLVDGDWRFSTVFLHLLLQGEVHPPWAQKLDHPQ